MRLSEKLEYVLKAAIFNFGDNYDYDEGEALEEMFTEILFGGLVKLNEAVDDNGVKWVAILDVESNSIDFYKGDILVDSESLVSKTDASFKARVNHLLDEDRLYNLMMKYETL